MYIILAVLVLTPALQMGVLELRRQTARRRLSRAHGSHVITLVHRLETVAIAGLPVIRFVLLEQELELVGSIDSLPPDVPIDLILHVPAGVVTGGAAIAAALDRRTAPVTVIVPYLALSDTAPILKCGRMLAGESARMASGKAGAATSTDEAIGFDGIGLTDDELLQAAGELLVHYAQPPQQGPAFGLLPLPAAQRSRTDR